MILKGSPYKLNSMILMFFFRISRLGWPQPEVAAELRQVEQETSEATATTEASSSNEVSIFDWSNSLVGWKNSVETDPEIPSDS